MRNIFIIIIFGLSSCFVNKFPKPNTSINFNGQVLARVQKGYRVDVTHPLKAELTLMKKDSTIISKIITDKDGNFNEDIKMNIKWNPLILKIRGLENFRIDTITKRDVSGYKLSCTRSPATFKYIYLENSTFFLLEFECWSSERAGNKEEE